MENARVSIELRTLYNMIRRYFLSSKLKQEIDNLTGNNGWIIGYLSERNDKATYQKDIEEHFNIARSTASKVLSLMEQKGLLERHIDENDGRLKRITLTEKAWAVQAIMRDNKLEMEKSLLKGFSDEEIDTLCSYITRMKENIAATQEQSENEIERKK